MFVLTMTGKRAVKIGFIAVLTVAAAAVGIGAVMTNLTSGAQEKKQPISSVERDDGKVALTFDTQWAAVGARQASTVTSGNIGTILDVLASDGVPATFFVSGDFAVKYPEIVRDIYTDGHEIGNGSYKYPNIVSSKDTAAIGINELIADTNAASQMLKKITGEMPKLYRAPYGEYTDDSLTTFEGMGLTAVKWSKDSGDTKEPEPAVIVKRMTKDVKSGDILLFHSDIANTAKALPEIISKLKERGLSFGTVSDIIYHGQYTVNSEGRQISASAPAADLSFEQESAAVSAITKIRMHLTPPEFEQLRNGVRDAGAEAKLSKILKPDELSLLSSLDPSTVSRLIDSEAINVSANPSGIPINSNIGAEDVYGEKGGGFQDAIEVGGYDSAGDYQTPEIQSAALQSEAPTEPVEKVPQIEPTTEPEPASQPFSKIYRSGGSGGSDERAEMTVYTDKARAPINFIPDEPEKTEETKERAPIKFFNTSSNRFAANEGKDTATASAEVFAPAVTTARNK